MALPWGFRRQLLYYAVAFVVFFVAAVIAWQIFFTNTPTCSDGIQNGTEKGIDCGGTCALICKETSRAPVVLWAHAFRTSDNTYSLAAYIQNNNPSAGARRVGYTFQLFDAKNSLVFSRDGETDIPPMNIVPIVVPSVDVGTRTVARTIFSFSENPSWDTIPKNTFPVLRTTNQILSPDGSRLSATIVNDTQIDAKKVSVIAVLFDAQGVALAASKSTLPGIDAKSSQDVVFTWSNTVPDVFRAEIIVLPSF